MTKTKDEKQRNKQLELKLVVNNSIELDADDPVPITKSNGNCFRTSNGVKYIPFIAGDDTFANKLLSARLTSASQHACISSISQSLIGNGLKIKDVETPDQRWLDWAKSVNKYRHSFDEELVSVIDGERNFGNGYLEVVKGVISGKPFLKIYAQPQTKCRIVVPNDDEIDEDIQQVLISNRLGGRYPFSYNENTDVVLPIWSPNLLDQDKVWKKDKNGFLRTIIHIKNDVSGVDWYGLPASIAGLRYQILEAKAAQFNIDNFNNNMILGGILIIKAGMTQEEAQEQARQIFLTHIGEGKTGRIAVIASEDGMNDVDFKPFETAREASYNDSDKRWEEKIIAANEWDSVLAGINRSSTFGNGSQYIRSIWDVKDAVLLNPLRKKLINKIVHPIVQIWAEHFGVKEVPGYQFELQSNMPFSFMGDLDPNTFFTVGEARAKANLKPDDVNGSKYLSEMRPKNTSNNNIQTNPDANTSTSNGTGTGNK